MACLLRSVWLAANFKITVEQEQEAIPEPDAAHEELEEAPSLRRIAGWPVESCCLSWKIPG